MKSVVEYLVLAFVEQHYFFPSALASLNPTLNLCVYLINTKLSYIAHRPSKHIFYHSKVEAEQLHALVQPLYCTCLLYSIPVVKSFPADNISSCSFKMRAKLHVMQEICV